jgi:hypothetical protein
MPGSHKVFWIYSGDRMKSWNPNNDQLPHGPIRGWQLGCTDIGYRFRTCGHTGYAFDLKLQCNEVGKTRKNRATQ